MADRPSGTVTLLFTDIVGSTSLWERHPHAMSAALMRHDAIIRASVESYSGQIFKTTGDGCYAVFADAAAALAAAVTAQRALAAERWDMTGPLHVRMALHSGAVEQRGSDYFGPPLNRLARLVSAAHGGQILLSLVTAELLRDQLPADVMLRDLGIHQLKDLTRPEHIFQLIAPDLDADFPPLKTLDAHPNNLPAQLTPLIGREWELASVSTLLRTAAVRLVTLSGPGGIGKTRLALQTAAHLLDAFADGAWFVALAPIRTPELVATTIAQTLGLRDCGNQPVLERLKSHLRDKQLLLVLDNFEQVIVAAPLITELLTAAAELKVLVTSRAVLHLSGERDYAVPPLTLPDRTQLPPVDRLAHYAAVRLFVERAQAVHADFAISHENAAAVAAICQHLDGLPLAIELAAARVKLFRPQALLARLTQRLELLTGGARDVPAHQQTLRGTLEWSYQLLHDTEQALFARLGVFVGGCTLDAAEAVTTLSDQTCDRSHVLDGLAALVDQSLLRQATGPDGEPRFTMLETIREYALERLAMRGETAIVRQRHAAYFLALVETGEPHLRGPGQAEWVARLEMEHDNLRSALAWDQARGAAELGIRFEIALRRFRIVRGYLAEGRQHLAAFLAQTGVPVGARANALGEAGYLAWWQSDYTAAAALWAESLALHRKIGDPRGTAVALFGLGLVALRQGDAALASAYAAESLTHFRTVGDQSRVAWSIHSLGLAIEHQGDIAAASARYEESLRLFRTVDDQHGSAWLLINLGAVAIQEGGYARAEACFMESLTLAKAIDDRPSAAAASSHLGDLARVRGDYAQAVTRYQESLAIYQAMGDQMSSAGALNDLGVIARLQGDDAAAATCYAASLALFRALEHPWGIALVHYNLGHLAHYRGDDQQARSLFAESLARYRALGGRQGHSTCLVGLAGIAGVQRQPACAARFFGAVEALLHAFGITIEHTRHVGYDHQLAFPSHARRHALLEQTDRVDYDRNLAAVRAGLDPATFEAAWAAGRTLTLDQAIAAVRGPAPATGSAPPPPTRPPALPAGLTRREIEVLRLVAQGLTDSQVAEALVVSPRTVHGHLRSIYNKLGVTSRTAAARFALEHRLS